MTHSHMFFGGLALGSGIWSPWLPAQIIWLILAAVIAFHGQRSRPI